MGFFDCIRLQSELNTLNNPEGKECNFKAASLVKLAKALEATNFSWWKKEQPTIQVTLELIDVLSFEINRALNDITELVFGYDFEDEQNRFMFIDEWILLPAFDLAKLNYINNVNESVESVFVKLINLVSSEFDQNTDKNLISRREAFGYLFELFFRYGYTSKNSMEEIMDVFYIKNAINRIRANNNYRFNGYIKEWILPLGLSFPDSAAAKYLIQVYEDDKERTPESIFSYLSNYYKHVVKGEA